MKKLITILLVFFSFTASSQVIRANRYYVPVASPYIYPLDIYGTDIVAAFSFRLLKSTYTGYCLKVKRLSDNAKQDIGFVNNYLDTTSLKTFVGSSSAVIHYWYDQSGVGTYASSNNTSANYFIVESGNIVYLNGFVAVRNKNVANTQFIINISTPYKVLFSAAKIDTFQRRNNITSSAMNDNLYYGGTDANITGIGGRYSAGWNNADAESLNLLIAYHNFSSGNLIVSKNGGSDTNTGAFSSSFPNINLLGSTNIGVDQFYGRAYELIFYSADKSSDKAAIINNINNFYHIY